MFDGEFINNKSFIIYEGKCSCELSYIRETKRNREVRWKEHKLFPLKGKIAHQS